MVENSVDKDELSSEPSILDLLQEGIVESRNIGTRLILKSTLTAVSISRLVTKHHVELYEVEVVSGSKVVEHHEAS